MMVVYLRRRGIRLSKTTVLKYMRERNLHSVVNPRKYRYKKGDCYKRFNNLFNRDFKAAAPNQKWCTDFTYIFLSGGAKRYNCSIIDLYDHSVATTNGRRMDSILAIDTLRKALDKNPAAKETVILHSDQGSQYTSRAFIEYCESMHVTQSMSRAGCPYDNAPMESFYGTFKAEFIGQHTFEDEDQLDQATDDYVYCYYNHIRPHSSNNYLTPFEKRHQDV